jgi:hypothetical protein
VFVFRLLCPRVFLVLLLFLKRYNWWRGMLFSRQNRPRRTTSVELRYFIFD